MKKKVFIGLFILLICLCVLSSHVKYTDTDRVYNCNVRCALNTYITTELNGSEVVIKGDIFKLKEDPLKMVDSDGNTIAFADDDFNMVNQDDHVICVNDDEEYILHGNFGIGANFYTLYDKDYNEIANVSFNFTDTKGSIKSVDGKVWAKYYSALVLRDYYVVISEDCELSDEAVLILMASYKSDIISDSKSK